MFSYSKQTQYTYLILLLVWLIISLHVGYRYISFSSEQIQGKGGTFVEATTEDINHLPYITNNDADKFYQSFLFNGCIYPSFSGTDISYRDELCHVNTSDYKTFYIEAVPGKYWSDGTPLTLNDIYFTYNTLLKNNYRSIGALDGFRNLSIIANEEDQNLQIIFPKASVDNMIFFTNFILPAHLLANQSLETYVTTFYQNPVGTNCSTLAPATRDEDSTVFDLSACTDVSLKFYQIKQFSDEQALQAYIDSSNDTVDLIISDTDYTGFTPNNVILNKFVSIFFNTQRPRLSPTLRQQLANIIQQNIYQETSIEDMLIRDHYLFDSFVDTPGSGLAATLASINTATSAPLPIAMPELPQILRREADDTSDQEYLLQTPIEDKKILKFVFDTAYEKISVSFNDGVAYFPESYNADEQSSYYNLNPTYRNIVEGRNTYTIKAYANDIHVDTYTFVVHYLSQPSAPVAQEAVGNNLDTIRPLQVIYFQSPLNNRLADILETLFKRYDLSEYIMFTAFDDPDILAGKIQSKDYDIVLSSINMGLRKDVSNFFATDNPNINPSLYTNEDMALATNEYFLFAPEARASIKQKINTLYRQDTPFVILGKEIGKIHIAESLSFPYPLRMYVLGRRKDFIKDLPSFQHVDINRDKVWKRSNFNAFLAN